MKYYFSCIFCKSKAHDIAICVINIMDRNMNTDIELYNFIVNLNNNIIIKTMKLNYDKIIYKIKTYSNYYFRKYENINGIIVITNYDASKFEYSEINNKLQLSYS